MSSGSLSSGSLEAARAARRGVSGRRGPSVLLGDVGEAGVREGRGEAEACAGGVAFRPTPTLTDVEGGARQEAKGVSGAGHVFPRGRSRRWRAPGEGGGACPRRGLQARLRPWSPAVSSAAR